MPNYKKVTIAGDVVEIEEYFSPRKVGENIIRGSNQSLTDKQQQERNLQLARRKLARKINANFSHNDYFLTLTHAKRLDDVSAKAALQKYLRRIRDFCKRNSLPDIRYIAVTETEKRPHHHLILNKEIPVNIIFDKWEYGRVMITKVDKGGDYTGLAYYITKEANQKRRWTCSRNLAEPIVIRTEIRRKTKELNLPPEYRTTHKIVQTEQYFSEVTGEIRYLKAVRIGGADLAEGGINPPQEVQNEHLRGKQVFGQSG